MPTGGTPDRVVEDLSGGGGGGGNVVVTNTPLPITGPVTIADGADVNAGSTTDVAETTDSDGTLSGKLRGLVKWAYERMPTSLGQKLMAASFPVTLASDQSAIPVSATDLDIRNLIFATDKVDASGTVLGAGANNIGDVDVLTIPSFSDGSGDVTLLFPVAVAAGTNLTYATLPTVGYIGVVESGKYIPKQVKVAHLDMTTATTTDIVAAVAAKKIRVLEYYVETNEPATVSFVNFARGAGTTRVTGSPRMRLSTDSQIKQRVAPTGAFLFETAAGEALRVTQDAATDISVAIVYVEA